MAPAGDPTAVREIITWSAIRPGNDYGTQQAKNDTLYLYGDAEYMLSDSWSVTLSNAFGHSRSYTNSDGLICTRCVYEALNGTRSEEHTSELQSLMRISYAGFCLKKK